MTSILESSARDRKGLTYNQPGNAWVQSMVNLTIKLQAMGLESHSDHMGDWRLDVDSIQALISPIL